MSYFCASFDYPGISTRNLCSGYHVAESHQLPCWILFFCHFFKSSLLTHLQVKGQCPPSK